MNEYEKIYFFQKFEFRIRFILPLISNNNYSTKLFKLQYNNKIFSFYQDKLEKAITEWRAVFLMGATVHFIGITIYGIFASGELQPWAEPTPPYEAPMKPLDQETTFVSKQLIILKDILKNIYKNELSGTRTRVSWRPSKHSVHSA